MGFDVEFWRRTGLNSRLVDEGGWTSKAKIYVQDLGIDEYDEFHCYYHAVGSFAKSKPFKELNNEFVQNVSFFWDIPVKLESFYVDLSAFNPLFKRVPIRYFQTRVFSGAESVWLGNHDFRGFGNYFNGGQFPAPKPINQEFNGERIDSGDVSFNHENIGYFYTYWGLGGIFKMKSFEGEENWQNFLQSIPTEIVANWQGNIYHV